MRAAAWRMRPKVVLLLGSGFITRSRVSAGLLKDVKNL